MVSDPSPDLLGHALSLPAAPGLVSGRSPHRRGTTAGGPSRLSMGERAARLRDAPGSIWNSGVSRETWTDGFIDHAEALGILVIQRGGWRQHPPASRPGGVPRVCAGGVHQRGRHQGGADIHPGSLAHGSGNPGSANIQAVSAPETCHRILVKLPLNCSCRLNWSAEFDGDASLSVEANRRCRFSALWSSCGASMTWAG